MTSLWPHSLRFIWSGAFKIWRKQHWDIFLPLHTQKRTAKILISIQYQQSSHLRYAKADYFCWTDSWTGDDAKLDRFLKRLEGAASHFSSPPQIRIALVCLVFTCSWTWERRWSQTQSRRWVWNLKDDLSLSFTSLPQHTAPHVNCPEFHPPWWLQSGTMYLYMSYENRMYVMKIRFNTALSD